MTSRKRGNEPIEEEEKVSIGKTTKASRKAAPKPAPIVQSQIPVVGDPPLVYNVDMTTTKHLDELISKHQPNNDELINNCKKAVVVLRVVSMLIDQAHDFLAANGLLQWTRDFIMLLYIARNHYHTSFDEYSVKYEDASTETKRQRSSSQLDITFLEPPKEKQEGKLTDNREKTIKGVLDKYNWITKTKVTKNEDFSITLAESPAEQPIAEQPVERKKTTRTSAVAPESAVLPDLATVIPTWVDNYIITLQNENADVNTRLMCYGCLRTFVYLNELYYDVFTKLKEDKTKPGTNGNAHGFIEHWQERMYNEAVEHPFIRNGFFITKKDTRVDVSAELISDYSLLGVTEGADYVNYAPTTIKKDTDYNILGLGRKSILYQLDADKYLKCFGQFDKYVENGVIKRYPVIFKEDALKEVDTSFQHAKTWLKELVILTTKRACTVDEICSRHRIMTTHLTAAQNYDEASKTFFFSAEALEYFDNIYGTEQSRVRNAHTTVFKYNFNGLGAEITHTITQEQQDVQAIDKIKALISSLKELWDSHESEFNPEHFKEALASVDKNLLCDTTYNNYDLSKFASFGVLTKNALRGSQTLMNLVEELLKTVITKLLELDNETLTNNDMVAKICRLIPEKYRFPPKVPCSLTVALNNILFKNKALADKVIVANKDVYRFAFALSLLKVLVEQSNTEIKTQMNTNVSNALFNPHSIMVAASTNGKVSCLSDFETPKPSVSRVKKAIGKALNNGTDVDVVEDDDDGGENEKQGASARGRGLTDKTGTLAGTRNALINTLDGKFGQTYDKSKELWPIFLSKTLCDKNQYITIPVNNLPEDEEIAMQNGGGQTPYYASYDNISAWNLTFDKPNAICALYHHKNLIYQSTKHSVLFACHVMDTYAFTNKETVQISHLLGYDDNCQSFANYPSILYEVHDIVQQLRNMSIEQIAAQLRAIRTVNPLVKEIIDKVLDDYYRIPIDDDSKTLFMNVDKLIIRTLLTNGFAIKGIVVNNDKFPGYDIGSLRISGKPLPEAKALLERLIQIPSPDVQLLPPATDQQANPEEVVIEVPLVDEQVVPMENARRDRKRKRVDEEDVADQPEPGLIQRAVYRILGIFKVKRQAGGSKQGSLRLRIKNNHQKLKQVAKVNIQLK